MLNSDISIRDLGEVSVLSVQTRQVKLSSLWETRTAVLVFVRHFG